MPRISIITPVYNRASMVGEALESVRNQGYQAHEHIVMDGASTDGTVELLAQTHDIIWYSEPDKGLYDAINQGIQRSTGDIIGLVNSDDILLPGALQAVANAFAANPDIDSVCGGALITKFDTENSVWEITETFDGDTLKNPDWWVAFHGPILTNARFFRRNWFDKIGYFDLRYRIAADREFLLRSLQYNLTTLPLPERLYEYREHTGSLTFNADTRSNIRLRSEYRNIALQYMHNSQINDEAQQMARRSYAVQIAMLVLIRLKQGKILEAIKEGLNAFKHIPAWPYHCLSTLFNRQKYRAAFEQS